MKKTIISIFMMLMLTLTIILPVEAVKINNKNYILDEIKTVSVHVFYDVNENNIQDEKEGDANDFYVWATPGGFPGTASQFFEGQTDINGNLTFEIDTDEFMMDFVRFIAREKIRNNPAQYKGTVGGIGGLEVKDGMNVKIPVVYEESVKSKNILHHRLSNILENIGLLNFLVSLF